MPYPPSSAYTVRDQERMERAQRYFEWQKDLVLPQLGHRVLEIGWGVGNFTRMLLDRELVVGIDIDSQCVQKHRERFADCPNVVSLEMDAADGTIDGLEQYGLDSVVALNVLEHIANDQAALESLWRLLPEGGRVVLIVPAFPLLSGPIDQLLGHYRRYTKTTLRDLAARGGFDLPLVRYMNTVGFFGWWLNARMLKKTEQSERQIAVFDSLIVPWLRRVEGLIPPPFGQSLFAVLRRRRAAAPTGSR